MTFIKIFRYYAAFTLAEVIIVLGIVGIIAEMTIPTLFNDINKQIYVTGLKKFYSSGNQALNLMASDYGCAGDLICTGVFNSGTTTVGSEIAKYFKSVKNCGTDSTGNTSCWANNISNNYDSDVTGTNFNTNTGYKFITIDGMSINIWDFTGNCTDSGSSRSSNGPLTQNCGELDVDVNGLKPPNRFGRDVFRFAITNAKGPMLFPLGAFDSTHYWYDTATNVDTCDFDISGHTNTNPHYGGYCAGRIIDQNWQMNY